MAIFFSADPHFFHAGVIKYANRPFADVDEMNRELVRRWNVLVSYKDEVYLLGDVSFGGAARTVPILTQLNGKIYLVRGNHDHQLKGEVAKRFEWIKDYHELKVHEKETNSHQLVVLCHYPLATWNKAHYGSWQLHGHSHGTLDSELWQKRLDVGVDCFSYAPVSYDEVKTIMSIRTFKPVDHHGAERE